MGGLRRLRPFVEERFSSPFLVVHLFHADDVYFSPKGHIRDQIIKRIDHSGATLDLAMYSLTSGEIAAALVDAGRRGAHVRIIRDVSQSREKNEEGFMGSNN